MLSTFVTHKLQEYLNFSIHFLKFSELFRYIFILVSQLWCHDFRKYLFNHILKVCKALLKRSSLENYMSNNTRQHEYNKRQHEYNTTQHEYNTTKHDTTQGNTSAIRQNHCVKSVQMRSYFWSVFSCIQTEFRKLSSLYRYSVSLRIQSEYRKNTDQK